MNNYLSHLIRSLFLITLLFGCNSENTETLEPPNPTPAPTPVLGGIATNLPLDRIKLPEGFKITVFAEVNNARSLALGADGTLFVGNRGGDKVYAVRDEDGDFAADQVYTLISGLDMPNGVAFRNGSLYIAELNRILRLDNIENQLDNPPSPVVVYDEFPTERSHGWKYIAFGPDNKLYVPVGAPCNICESAEPIFSTITRMDPDGSNFEIFASGVRNSVGFDWHPDTQDLWFTENGGDWLGDDQPNDELNFASETGLHYGYPYCHEGTMADPELGNLRNCDEFQKPIQKLGPHVAALGMKFYQGNMFPESYKNNVLIANHGSWNRSSKIGYNISRVKLENNQSAGFEVFAEGWLDEATQQAWGRPVDVLEMPDGSLLVSDDRANVVYRIVYAP